MESGIVYLCWPQALERMSSHTNDTGPYPKVGTISASNSLTDPLAVRVLTTIKATSQIVIIQFSFWSDTTRSVTIVATKSQLKDSTLKPSSCFLAAPRSAGRFYKCAGRAWCEHKTLGRSHRLGSGLVKSDFAQIENCIRVLTDEVPSSITRQGRKPADSGVPQPVSHHSYNGKSRHHLCYHVV